MRLELALRGKPGTERTVVHRFALGKLLCLLFQGIDTPPDLPGLFVTPVGKLPEITHTPHSLAETARREDKSKIGVALFLRPYIFDCLEILPAEFLQSRLIVSNTLLQTTYLLFECIYLCRRRSNFFLAVTDFSLKFSEFI